MSLKFAEIRHLSTFLKGLEQSSSFRGRGWSLFFADVALKQKKLDQFWPQAINLDGHTAAGLVGGLDGRHGGHVR